MSELIARRRRPIGAPPKLAVSLLGAIAVGCMVGCAMLPPNSFIDPTKVGMFPLDYKEGSIRRVLTPLESPDGLENATDPTPEDLVVEYEEYRLQVGDFVSVNVEDLIQQGIPYNANLQVSPTGFIKIPQLGTIRVLGLTDRELENEILVRVQEAQLLPQPIVQVFVTRQSNRYFTIVGNVRIPGTYPLERLDTRLLDVVGRAGDTGPNAKWIYVIRRVEDGDGDAGRPASGGTLRRQPEEAPPVDDLVIPPPDPNEDLGFFHASALTQDGVAPRPVGDPVNEFAGVLEDGRDEQRMPSATPARHRPLVFDPTTGKMRELEEQPTAPAPATRPAPSETMTPESRFDEALAPPPGEDFDWDDVDDYEIAQRVIQISVDALRAGDPLANIVIRDRDVIQIPIDTGLFYLMGEVNRPGVFSFNGREITLKRAVALTGGLSALAWPQRCEIIRRIKGTDQQLTIPVNLDAIFAGLEPDVLLQDDDLVNVGTHIVAPFLFVIRNSFRFTYGFGFVYDRNFADKDSFGSRLNPEIAEQQRRSQLGLPF